MSDFMEFVSRQQDKSHLEFILSALNLSKKESSTYGVLSQDRKNLVNYMNSKAVEIFDFSPEELLGKRYSILMPEDCRKGHQHFVSLAMKNGQAYDNSAVRFRKEGIKVKVDELISRIKPNGVIYGVAYKVSLCRQ